MKVFRFVAIAIAISLLLGAFAPFPTQKNIAATTSGQTTNRAAWTSPFTSPFLLAASAPVIEVVTGEAYDGYACTLNKQTPTDWTQMKRRQIFDVHWTLKNTGKKVWGARGVDVKFRGGFPTGTVMHYNVPNLFDLPRTVTVGDKIMLSMDMIAPRKPGYYVDNWGLYVGGQVFCKFYIAITVTG
jgi:hypothetical protein